MASHNKYYIYTGDKKACRLCKELVYLAFVDEKKEVIFCPFCRNKHIYKLAKYNTTYDKIIKIYEKSIDLFEIDKETFNFICNII